MKRTLCLLAACCLLLCGCEKSDTFTTERWLNDPENRTAIIDDLLANYPLVGMTEQEIIDLLGKNTNTSYFKADNRFVYRLGDERGLMSIDSEWLLIDFENGIVADYSVTSD